LTFWSFDVLIILKILLMFWPFDVLIFDVLTLSCLNIVRLATEPVTSTDVTRQVFKPDLEQCKIIWPPQMNLGFGRRLRFFKDLFKFPGIFHVQMRNWTESWIRWYCTFWLIFWRRFGDFFSSAWTEKGEGGRGFEIWVHFSAFCCRF
jgi:hypothetical protein